MLNQHGMDQPELNMIGEWREKLYYFGFVLAFCSNDWCFQHTVYIAMIQLSSVQ